MAGAVSGEGSDDKLAFRRVVGFDPTGARPIERHVLRSDDWAQHRGRAVHQRYVAL